MKYTCLVQDKDKKCCRFPAMKEKQHCMFHYDINTICDNLPELSEVLFDKLKNGLTLGVIHIKKGEFDWRPESIYISKIKINEWGYIVTEYPTNVQIHKPRFYTKEEHKMYRDSMRKKWRKMKAEYFDDDEVEMENDDLFPVILGTGAFAIFVAFLLWLYIYSETGDTIRKLLSSSKNINEL
jgi:hypothetical protein